VLRDNGDHLKAANPPGVDVRATPSQQPPARKTWLSHHARRLWASKWVRRARYWLTVALVFGVSYWLSPQIYDGLQFSYYRARWFQALLDHGARRPIAKDVRLVLIGDDEYYSDDFKRSHRKYLATLVRNLADSAAHAGVIGLDFDLRLEDPKATTIADRDLDDTCDLIDSIHAAAARGSKVILATPIVEESGAYHRRSDAYQAFGLCGAPAVPGLSARCNASRSAIARSRGNKTILNAYSTEFAKEDLANVACGYIALPRNFGEIPIQLMADGAMLDSFGLATARASEVSITTYMLEEFRDEFPIGHFMKIEKFEQSGHEIAAGEVYRNVFSKELINGKIVMIGASWHTRARGEGELIDNQDTPAGPMVGVVLHANFVESLLDQRTAFNVSESWLVAIEIGFGIFAAFVFARYTWWWGLGAFLPLVLLMFLVQWVMLQALALYFDVLVPLLGLAVHSVVENFVGSHPHGHRQGTSHEAPGGQT